MTKLNYEQIERITELLVEHNLLQERQTEALEKIARVIDNRGKK